MRLPRKYGNQRHSEIPACIIRPLKPISPLLIWYAVVEGLILCLHSGCLLKNSCLEVQCWFSSEPPVATAYPQQPVFQNTKSFPLKGQIFIQLGLRSRQRPPRFGILGGRFREVRLYLFIAYAVCEEVTQYGTVMKFDPTMLIRPSHQILLARRWLCQRVFTGNKIC